MGYHTVVSFSTNKTKMTIKGTFRSSNSYDCYGRKEVVEIDEKHEDKKEFDKSLISFAESFLGGTIQFPPSSPFAKKVNWLVENGYVPENKCSFKKEDLEFVADVLAGRKNVKVSEYIFENDKGYVLRAKRNGVTIYPKGSRNRRGRLVNAQKLTKNRALQILTDHKDFLEKHGMQMKKVS